MAIRRGFRKLTLLTIPKEDSFGGFLSISRRKQMSNRSSSARTKVPQADVLVTGGGTLFVFHALSDSAKDWITENVSREGFNPQFPNVLYVEHRYARDLAAGMIDFGLVVR
jgi:hypothetical protein